jgi:transcriptional regulator with XRE-family HTH domain
MGHLERGEKNVSFTTLVRLSDALGITVSELLSDERSTATKTVRKTRKNQTTDLPDIIRELNQQRNILDSTSGVLKQLTRGLQVHEAKWRRKNM